MTALPRKIRYHYSRPGRSVTIHDQWLVVDRPDHKVLLLEEHAGKPFRVDGRVVQDRGAPIIWYVFPGMWYDVGRFHLADGTFTGWYTNFTTPPDIRAEEWFCTDMFLDLWTPRNGASQWLDEDELADAIAQGVVDSTRVARVSEERDRIQGELQKNAWPPSVARTIDLAHVRKLFPA